MTAAVPGYRVGAPLAAGRRGPVHHGVRLADGLATVIHLHDAPLDERRRQRFLAEAAALRRLPAAPQLVPLLEAGVTDDGRPYLVTPAGERTMADRLAAEGRLPAGEVLEAGVAAAAGLEALHGAGLLHGNVSPGNLLLLANGLVALTGFALPVLAELDPPSPWQPPEVLRGGDWTAAGDLYALAATLFTLLAGEPPYGPPGEGRLARVLTEPVPALPRADVPGAAAAALRRALDPDPAARFATPAAFAAALRAAPEAPAAVRDDTLPPGREGRQLGSRYLLHEVIGGGASGQVWRGSGSDDGRPFAVKLLRPELAEQPEVVARFVRERTTLERLDHPNLVRVRDLVAEGTTLALVMDLVDGHDLRRTMSEAPLTQAEACGVLAQVAMALDAIHRAGVVHRDLKPENVLVRRQDGEAVALLTDFGIARGAGDATLTRITGLVGTPAYVAPEVAAGRRATPASDVYALGVMAYELLAGERPFDADHPMALLHAHLTEEPARPEGMPGSAWRLLRACLAKDPAERPDAARLADSFVTLAAKLAGRAPLGPLPAPPDGASRQRGWQAEPAAAATRGGAGAALATSASELPPPPAPAVPEPPRRGGWRVLLAVLLAAAIVGGGTGILLARSRSGGSRHGGPPATAGPGQGLPYAWVPVTASSPRPGTIVLRFGGGGVPAGLQSYAVLNDGHPIADALAASASRYTVSGLQPGAVHCFSVIALLATPAPTDAGTRPPKPTCRRADGRPTPR